MLCTYYMEKKEPGVCTRHFCKGKEREREFVVGYFFRGKKEQESLGGFMSDVMLTSWIFLITAFSITNAAILFLSSKVK